MTTKLLFVLSLTFPLHAFGWGAVGHRAVGVVAETKLTQTAKDEVKKLLGRETLADVATWADEVRSDGTYKQTTWYHFEKINDGISYIDNLKKMPEWQQKKGGVVMALLFCNQVLRDPQASNSEKKIALKLLVHFIGDIHQPFHSGRADDKGGVTIKTDWFG